MFWMFITRQGGLHWETETDRLGSERICWNENDKGADRLAKLELGGRRVGKETYLHDSELLTFFLNNKFDS